ncbi:MAG TPA: enoyl-CoA hydratase/isomerase family protein, partial [Vicinamibacteria bacterium]|nr:enoyl-CoA hydratase/isomerase family protein [Vicinamibacteria bacterium]
MKGEVFTEEREGSFWVSFSRPPVNVLDLPMIQEIHTRLSPLASRPDMKVVVIRSGLPGVFSAGVEVRDHARDRVQEMLATFHGLIRTLVSLPQASVASVDGHCLGGGCELAAVCDFVLASPAAIFGQPEIDLGCFPPVAAALLPRILGRAASEMVLLGGRLSADEAAQKGLVSRVVSDLQGETVSLASRLAQKSGAALALARKALRAGETGTFREALDRAETIYTTELLKTDDVQEGVL